jgi:small subunit ribosomal protein S6
MAAPASVASRPGQTQREEIPPVRDYELTLILRPDLGEEGVHAAVDRVGGWVGASGDQVANVLNAGRKRLSYSINHLRDGIYVVLDVRARPDSLGEVERNLKLSNDVVRYMFVRKP